MSGEVLLDLTSLVAAPDRSGIQRVEREVLRHWPDPDLLIPCVLDPSGLIWRLPVGIRDVLCPAAEPPRGFAEDQRALARLLLEATPMGAAASRHVLNLELFYDSWRAEAYAGMCEAGWRVQWLLYDFMPWLAPDLFDPGTTQHCMHYLRALRHVAEVAFISGQTRDEYHRRIMRRASPTGPVLPLGADGLGLERQKWSPDRRAIVVLGSIERRKNPHLVVSAFRRLWEQGIAAPLVFAGRVSKGFESQLRDLAGAQADGLLQILDQPADADVRNLLRRARAVLNASEIEGFGLAPYEALHCGIPVITPRTLPSLDGLSPAGQIRLASVNAEGLANAVRRVMDDAAAEMLWSETAGQDLPTWRAFVHSLADWARPVSALV